MKKTFTIAILFLLCITLVACSREQSDTDASDNISESIVTVTLNGYGKTVQLFDTELISQVKSIVDGITFESTASEVDLEAPGAISLTITFNYQDGSQDKITYPYCLRDGNILVADEASVKAFDEYFE